MNSTCTKEVKKQEEGADQIVNSEEEAGDLEDVIVDPGAGPQVRLRVREQFVGTVVHLECAVCSVQ